MSTDLESIPSVSTRRLEGSLVAPTQFGLEVSDHLSETKIFNVAQEQSAIKTKPPVINFEGYTVGKLHQQTLHIINTSGDNIGVHIIPPTTQFFVISYKKTRSQLVPGLSVDVTISFRPAEYKYYYDCIHLHCEGNDNLLVPIHAYPVLNTSSFPRSITFSPTPVGQSRSHTISFHNPIPVDFEYQFNIVHQHPAFSVSSMKGIVPANGKATISVKYSPMEYCTAVMKLQLNVLQFNFHPIICTFTGNAIPGLALEQYKEEQRKRKTNLKQQQKNPQKTSRNPKPLASSFSTKTPIDQLTTDTVEYEGYHIPLDLNTPSAVARVLSQKPNVTSSRQLKSSSQDGTKTISYKLKETVFLQKVKEIDEEEKANKLRWIKHIGLSPMTSEEKEQVLKTRNESRKTYKIKCNVPDYDEETSRTLTELSKRRTRRPFDQLPEDSPLFDMQSNNPWLQRYRALQRFIQAGRKVIIQIRIQKKLEMLRKVVKQLKSGKELSDIEFNISTKKMKSTINIEDIVLSPSLILPPTFPEYIDFKKTKDDLPSNSVQTQPVKIPATSQPKHLFELQVPKEYILLNYSQYPIPNEYVPTESNRTLRTGAEAEFIASEHKLMDDDDQLITDKIMPLLEPSPALLEPPKEHQHPYHIFNPCPEVINSLWPSLPNSEVTWEHYLSPIPTGTGAPQPQPKLDPYEGIPEIMSWKKFPSPFLSTLEGRKTISSVWRPCLTDPFSTDLLPYREDPEQLDGPQPDDMMSGNNDELPVPTIEMIKAEFYVPDTQNEPISTREQCEAKLKEEHEKWKNQAGRQYQQKYAQLLSLLK